MSNKIDSLTENVARIFAKNTSRRGLFSRLGALVAGVATIPLLPVARGAGPGDKVDMGNGYDGVASQPNDNPQDPGDPSSCSYWRYCAIDGYLCTCCGGTHTTCPPGTEMSPLTWIGTCLNPADGRSYIISYNDCCGANSCGRCICYNSLDDKPMVRPQANNDINWCLGSTTEVYNCTTAIIAGVALDSK